jgi:hypothetical protein
LFEGRQEPFIVKDATGQQIAYLYFEDEPQRQMSMKRLSKCATADIEGHSEAAEYGKPG